VQWKNSIYLDTLFLFKISLPYLLNFQIDLKSNLLASEREGSLIMGPETDTNMEISYAQTTSDKNWHFRIRNAWIVAKKLKFECGFFGVLLDY
jgi:hypothetical protein